MNLKSIKTINTIEDWFSIISTGSFHVILHILSHAFYDFIRRFRKEKNKVKTDFFSGRQRVLFDKTGRAAIHGYKQSFFYVKPGVEPFLDSDLTVEQMLVKGKTHKDAHNECLKRYDFWISKSHPIITRYLLWNRRNKFYKILKTKPFKS